MASGETDKTTSRTTQKWWRWFWLGSDATYESDKIGPDTDDQSLRQVFSESCQMYRHYLLMRYYSLAGCGIFLTALAAAWINLFPKEVPLVIAIVISLAGCLMALFCWRIDLRLDNIARYLAQQCDRFAKELTGHGLLKPVIERPAGGWQLLPRHFLNVVFIVGAVSWITVFIWGRTPLKTPSRITVEGGSFEVDSQSLKLKVGK